MMYNKSEQIAEGLRKSFERGDCKMANRVCYGYNTLPDGELVIKEVEAEIVRWIFESYIVGESLGKIVAGLEKKGILSPNGKPKWNREGISKLLSNEKYTGAVLLQKTMSVCSTQFANDGELQQVLIENHHEAIISQDIFDEVQDMKLQRFRKQERIISIIPSTIRNEDAPSVENRMRVAAYCRVSSPSDEQSSSLETQITYYTNKINQPPWTKHYGNDKTP